MWVFCWESVFWENNPFELMGVFCLQIIYQFEMSSREQDRNGHKFLGVQVCSHNIVVVILVEHGAFNHLVSCIFHKGGNNRDWI